MRKDRLEDKTPVGEIEFRIWEIIDLLKGQGVGSDKYTIVLFFLSAYKDGLISSELLSVSFDFKNTFLNQLYKDDCRYSQIIRTVEPILERISQKGLEIIVHIICSIDKVILEENFPQIFDSVLYKLAESQGKKGGLAIQPLEITRLIYALAELPENAKVFNPFAGLASFGVFLKGNQKYFGQELNQKNWAIGTMRIWANQRENDSIYKSEDSISEWPNSKERFDLVVANPPFGMRFRKGYREVEPHVRTIEHFLIEKGLDSISSDGKLIAIIPQGFLFRGAGEEVLRKKLVEEDLIDIIISLPGGLLLNTSIPITVIVLNKNKRKFGFVKFVNAERFTAVNEKSKRRTLDYNHLVTSLNDNNIDNTDAIQVISNSRIKSFDFNLNVPRYFQKEIKGTPLKELLESVKVDRSNLPSVAPFIRVRDLKDDKIEFRLRFNEVSESEIRRKGISRIKESCLLFASRWKTLKPTSFEYEGEAIYKTPDILAFKINHTHVDSAFLINELHADYVTEQLNARRVGTVIPHIRKDDLLDVVVKLPSIEEQIASVQTLKEAARGVKKAEEEFEKELLELKDSSFREMASIRHSLRQYLNALKSNVLGTKRFIERNEGNPISLAKIYSINLNKNFGQHINGMISTIDNMSELLSDFETDDKNDKRVEYRSNLLELVQTASLKFSDNSKFLFEEIYFDENSFFENGRKYKPMVSISQVDFLVAFSNVISNAIEHGFKEEKTGYKIRISISYDASDQFCVLEISNNGKPMNPKFDLKRLVTRGEKTTDSAGTGIGGADIQRIIKKYNGIFEIDNDTEREYPVMYIIKMPLKTQ